MRALGATGAALTFAHFDAKKIGESGDAARDLLFVEARKAQAERVGQRSLHIEVAAGGEEHAAFAGSGS